MSGLFICEKQVFLCRACGVGGDAIDFVRKLKNLSFREALIELRMDTTATPPRRRCDPVLVEARRLARWANEMTAKANCLLRECGRRIHGITEGDEVAHRVEYHIRDTDKRPSPLSQEYKSLACRWRMLETLAEDLQNEEHVLELYRQREVIENILNDAVEEPTTIRWPALTSQYQTYLKNLLPSESKKKSTRAWMKRKQNAH